MNEEIKQKLVDANLPEAWHEHCFITEDGMIFTPTFNEDGTVKKTGEQVYNEDYLNPPAPPKTELELLKEQLELTTQTLNFVMTMM